jgi:2-amino-4-hydroxy-6-hydroxymethyldihydropteridine diphosphokinase
VRFFLGLGSNLGDRAAQLRNAVASLESRGIVVLKASSMYDTDPVGGPPDQRAFLNQVIEVESGVGARHLLVITQEIEAALGRDRRSEERWGPRPIDIDILAGDEEMAEPGLTVPHLRLAQRAFVLIPLAELDPDLVIAGHTVAELASAVGDEGVRRTPA